MTIDVIRLAREAGSDNYPGWPNTVFLKRFAALVMEEDAKVCENMQSGWASDDHISCAAAIRARKP